MALVQASGQILDPSREKTSGPADLKKEVQTRRRYLRIDAYVGIVGCLGSGRKTLAYRLCHLDEGILEEVPVNYRYELFLLENFAEGVEINSNDAATLTLHFYIIEPPAEFNFHIPPRYWEYWNEFCCLAFCFDVRNQRSFHEVGMKINTYRERDLRIPNCVLVGNKSDRRYILPRETENRDDPEYLDQREIMARTARIEAHHLRFEGYIECSARTSERVGNLLRYFKVVAVAFWYQG